MVGEDGESPSPETIHARSVLLSDDALGAIARNDLIEGQGNVVTPVDYKHGTAPDVPEGAWEPERVQVCIQGLLLRANGYTSTEGMLYFVESRQPGRRSLCIERSRREARRSAGICQ